MRPLLLLAFVALAAALSVVARPPDEAVGGLSPHSLASLPRASAMREDYSADYSNYPPLLSDLMYRSIALAGGADKPSAQNPRSHRSKKDEPRSLEMYPNVPPPYPYEDFADPATDLEYYDSPVEFYQNSNRISDRRKIESLAKELFEFNSEEEEEEPVKKSASNFDLSDWEQNGGVVMYSEGQSGTQYIQDMRQPRQNPNKIKTASDDVQSLQPAQAHSEAHQAVMRAGKGSQDGVYAAMAPRPSEEHRAPFYTIAVYAVTGAALSVAVVGIGFGWYTLSKKAKAAEDVDYPAYGVTGPVVDTTDRRLAHSAHMYHYQHQKQQIIAMERGCCNDERSGSVSDPESEEENEEGDYTVYECPGYATTGEMEVKNPLFSDEPTPATPAAPADAADAVPATPAPANAASAPGSPAIVVDQPAPE